MSRLPFGQLETPGEVRSMSVKSLSIQNFRSLRQFELKDLGRVNLLVGTNNCGKTTLLEAISILLTNAEFSAIWATLTRRGEDLYGERESGAVSSRQVDIRRLFTGHEINVGQFFRISAATSLGPVSMTATIHEYETAQPQLFDNEPNPSESNEDFFPPLSLVLSWDNRKPRPLYIPISRRGGISSDTLRRNAREPVGESFPIRFITATSLSPETVSSLFEEIVLTPDEDLVVEAMRIIEPSIERIASSGEKVRSAGRIYSRGGILCRLQGVRSRVPIGSMGDGIWRMLGLALAVVQTDNGVLLIDEIDTGLHHSVIKDMWRFLYKCACNHNVQIIATTHSWDCYHALATICREGVSDGSDVTISRIERGRETAVTYTEQEIIAASERDLEVR
jgi:ABC-type branched-subunit amino acid transport system ATPase component